MANLSSLRSDLNYWNGQVNAMNDKIKKLKRRRNDVDSVISTLKSTVNNNAGDVNSRMRSAGGKLDRAISYSGKGSQVNAILSGKDERTLGSDNNLTAANEELQRELNDINRKLGEAEDSLTTANRRVSDTRTAIAAEERRQREEAARKAAEAIAKALKK